MATAITPRAVRAGFRFLATSVLLLSCSGADTILGPDPLSRPEVADVKLTAPVTPLSVGKSLRLHSEAIDKHGNVIGVSFAWASEPVSVATVSPDGLISAIAPGTARITATAEGKSASVELTIIPQPVASVSVTGADSLITVGQTTALTASPKDSSGNLLNGRVVTWSALHQNVATVSATGVVIAIGVGTTTIIASSEGATGSFILSVRPAPVSSITFATTASSIIVGQAFAASVTLKDAAGNTLTGRTVTWSSANPTVATASGTGVVTGVSPGTTTIAASSEGVTTSIPISVSAVPVAGVSVTVPVTSVTVGQSVLASASPRDAAGNPLVGRSVSWTSMNSAVAVVSSSGVITAVAPGSATITAASEGVTGSITISVGAIPVATVTVTASALALVVGQSVTASAAVKDASGAALVGRVVTWSSLHPDIARVSESGVITALAPGSATIVAMSEGVNGSLIFSVARAPVATVAVSASSSTLMVGQSLTITANLKDASGNILNDRVVVWTTPSPAVVSVNSSGVATGISAGSATIVATSEGVTGSVVISVTLVPVASVVVTAPTASIFIGEDLAFSASVRDGSDNPLAGRTVSWSSTNPGVAVVNQAGVVTGVAAGNATIVATSEGITGSKSVAVSPVPVSSVVVTAPSSSLPVGQSLTSFATVRDAGGNVLTGRTVIWSSSSPAVATVGATGVITGVDVGTASIVATSEGVTGSLSVSVTGAAKVVIVSANSVLYEHGARQLSATAEDAEGRVMARPIVWASSNTAVATVSASGTVTAVSAGTVTITARADGSSATLALTVRRDPLILVHGFGSSGAAWNFAVARLQQDGWRPEDIVAWSYNSLQSNVTTALQLKSLVDSVVAATGATRVDIMSHSMGGLPTRYYVKNHGGGAIVDAFISLAGPNHGTTTANSCAFASCIEMRVGSAFLTALNADDETPGNPRYATWWSPCDATIIPNESVLLIGAVNTQTSCVGHSQLHSDPAIYEQVRDWLGR